MVHGGPAPPTCDIPLGIRHNYICPQRNGPEYLDGGEGNQAKVPATAETFKLGGRHYLSELTMTLEEQIDSRDWK